MRRFLRDPVVLFLLLGSLIFVVDRMARRASPLGDTIVVSETFVRGLAAEQRTRIGRAPTSRETEALVARFVAEEVLVREALRLELDAGDTMVRRRLAQKMEFYLRSTLENPEPTDAEIAAYIRAHPDAYTEPGRYAFTHSFFSRDARGPRARADATAALENVRAGRPAGGDAFALGASQTSSSRADIAARYGSGFASQLDTCEEDVPCGPLESAFGYHVVVVTETSPGAITSVANARARAVPDMVRERENEAYAAALRERIARYDVERAR